MCRNSQRHNTFLVRMTSVVRTFLFVRKKMSESINERIAKYRRFRGYSQKDMAELIGVNLTTYSQRERSGKVTCDFLIKVAYFLNVNILTLLYGTDIEPFTDDEEFSLKLSHTEIDHIKMLRNISRENKKEILELTYNKFKNR